MNLFNQTFAKIANNFEVSHIINEGLFVPCDPKTPNSFYDKFNKMQILELPTDKVVFNFNLFVKNQKLCYDLKNCQLINFFNFPPLYNYVKSIQNVNLDLSYGYANGTGESSYDRTTDTIKIICSTKEIMIQKFFHELQHAIQKYCGMLRGGDYDTCRDSGRSIDKYIVMLSQKICKLYKDGKTSTDEFWSISKKLRNTLKNNYRDDDLLYQQCRISPLTLKDLFYHKIKGEVQARESENRRDFSQEKINFIKPNLKH